MERGEQSEDEAVIDIEVFFEEVVECLWDTLSREELLLLLNEFLERIEAEASLSREEVEALCKFLNELKTDLAMEDQERFQQDLLDRQRFLKEFPQVKQELEESISKLCALADRADKSHRDWTIFKVVANSTGTVSGVLSTLGLALAPVTAGASLAFLTIGLGLGAAAAVPTVSSSIVDHFSRSSAETEASGPLSTSIKEKVSVGARLHLHERAKAELAEKLRQPGRELEEELKEAIQTYERLKEGPTPPPPEQCRNQGHT
ncbi:hypothetical protein CapIbe_004728 [Capra ibex]